MFFKMIKKDLQKRGLNIILFLFMLVASTLVVVSTIQVYAHLEGKGRSYENCNSSELVIVNESKMSEQSENVAFSMDWFQNRGEVEHLVHSERIRVDSACIDFMNYDEDNNAPFFEREYFLCKQPIDQNIVFDLDDEPFYVENGCIALPQNTMDLTGAKIGDKVTIMTMMGYSYEFTITYFFKDPINQGERFLLSDADYELIQTMYPIRQDAYEMQLRPNADVETLINAYSLKKLGETIYIGQVDDPSDYAYIYLYVVSVFMVILSVFMILIIMMTIRFTMIAAINEEEKEIGMMKAIGVDSFRFRWLFAAKYIAFAIFSGVVGIIVGIPLGKIFLNMFMKNRIQPSVEILVFLGISATTTIVAVIILFTLFVMRRINRISVIDAIHGKSKGERYVKASKLHLHLRKHMKVKTYLAVSDILNGLHRYLFLIISYTLGVVIILCTVHLKNSVMSVEFERYLLTMRMDFYLDFNDELTEEYMRRTGGDVTMTDVINQDIKAAGIPASIDMDYRTDGTLSLPDGGEKNVRMLHGDFPTEEFIYRNDGVAPKLDNEIALSYFTASAAGYKLGDCVSITYDEYLEDGIRSREVTREFVITAFFDLMEGYFQGEPAVAIMGDEFYNGVHDGRFYLQEAIHAPKEEFPEVFRQLQELFGESSVKTTEEALEYYMADFNLIFSLMEYVLSGVIILVMTLITALNSTVLLTEEVPQIAMLKSLGLNNQEIKSWQMLRMGIIVILSLILGNLILDTVGQSFVSYLFGFLGLTGFTFIIEPIVTYLVVPFIIVVVVMGTMWIRLRSISEIEIWKIRED